MTGFHRFTLAVDDGPAIERAALRALLAKLLPQFSHEEHDEHDDEAERIAVLDLDGVPGEDIAAMLEKAAATAVGLVVLSSSDSLEPVRAVLRRERAAFVWKGDDPSELAAAVVSVASGRTWISDTARHRLVHGREERRPVLSPQESRVMRAYGSGAAVRVVALDLGVAEHTVRTYIKRIRAKYLETGVTLDSRVDFYRHLDDHDVAIRRGGDRVRADPQQVAGDARGDVRA
ncbi:LuxR C-terminal-related transcriptional regulator [Rathayibacter tanaceti]|uniref:Transcriptional regulatory protein UhpA n=2 Tax=Rathayibacter tanaceti TaxID=1671680 RepID=A0A166I3B0_9MICO|nr:LuxR C-terminal-related transcriptional regulator [Rathayibacter tanaceti]KZX21563.1 Transcriptional regulatory protein UhpA [Rathayibacter tanaceti]QHC56307.1 hypothetical protein GSU10_12125 [Rathayibacter tanaceti]TCO37168.1 DNA-binding NarL/FixJ family response regulator [Rathayibacter tanaceti]